MGKHSIDNKSNNKKKLSFGILIFRIISIIIILIALYMILTWYKENQNNKNVLQDTLSDLKSTQIVEYSGSFYTLLDIDFNDLLKKNKDTIGWIYIPNTSVNYSIVQSSDNNYYLNHSFNNSENSAGWIFMDYRCNSDFSSKNTVIYGHNRRDGSMFGTLKTMLKSDWYNCNKFITIATPNGNRIYEIFSMYTIHAESYYITTGFNSDSEYNNFLNTIKSRSIYDFGVNLSTDDSIITLSTCSGLNNARTVIHAKLIEIK